MTVEESTNVNKLGVFERCVEICQTKTVDSLNFNPVDVVLLSDHVSLSGGTGGASVGEFADLLNLCYLCP